MNICIISPSKDAYSETFIRNLPRGLKGAVLNCYGGFFPTHTEDGELKNYQSPALVDVWLKRLGIINKSLPEYYLVKYLRKKKVDVIIANYGPTGASVARIAQELDIPLIVHFYGYDAAIKSVLEKYKAGYQSLFRIAKAIITVSDEMTRDLITMGAPPGNIHKIVCVPSSDFTSVTPDYQSNQLLAIGRFVEKKSPHLSLMAFKQVVEKNPELQLKMVGDGPLLAVCRDLVSALRIPQVEFAGVLTPEQIRMEYERSFCFIQHSKMASDGDKEGMPVAILDSMAAGLAVVSTQHAGIPEIVRPGVNGYLVPEGDVDGMAKWIEALHTDREKAASMGAAGRRTIVNNFTSEAYFATWNQLLESLA